MSIIDLRFLVSDWQGTFKFIRQMGGDGISTPWVDISPQGIKAVFTGLGSPYEMTFAAIASTIPISERDLVILDTTEDGTTWTRQFMGVATKTGNRQLLGEFSNYKIVSVKKKFEQAIIIEECLEGDSGQQFRDTVRFLVNAARKQLGGFVTLNDSLVPNTGLILGMTTTRGTKAIDFLNYLAGVSNRVWDLDLYGQVFMIPLPTTTMVVDESEPGYLTTYEDTDSDALITSVTFEFGKALSGRPITYTVDLPEANTYGYASQTVILAQEVQVYSNSPDGTFIYDSAGRTFPPTWKDRLEGYNRDGTPSTPSVGEVFTPADPLSMSISLYCPPGSRQVAINANTSNLTLKVEIGTPQGILVGDGENQSGSYVYQKVASYPPSQKNSTVFDVFDRAVIRLSVDSTIASTAAGPTTFYVGEFRLDRVNVPLLTALARIYSVLPGRDPGTVTVGVLKAPAPNVAVYYQENPPRINTVAYVAKNFLLEGVYTEITLGQKLPAEERARQFLTTQLINNAVVLAARAK